MMGAKKSNNLPPRGTPSEAEAQKSRANALPNFIVAVNQRVLADVFLSFERQRAIFVN